MTESTLDVLDALLAKAKAPEDLFGKNLKTSWRALALAYHPDKYSDQLRPRATKLFAALSEWHQTALLKEAAGTYGDNKPHKVAAPYTETDIKLGPITYKLVRELGRDGLSVVHEASNPMDDKAQFFVKMARKPSDNDLLEREFRNLKLITAPDSDPHKEKEFFAKQRVYVPHPVQQFQIQGANKANHKASLMVVNKLPHLTLNDLMSNPKYHGGIPHVHAYWIFRRLLMTLWMAHLRGIVHGGVNPDHILVYPEAHGIVLLDWTASALIDREHILIIDDAWRDSYPPEVFKKALAQPNMDLYMAGYTLIKICPDLPGEVVKHVSDHCLDRDPSKRTQDICHYHDKFEQLIERLHGPRKFAVMEV